MMKRCRRKRKDWNEEKQETPGDAGRFDRYTSLMNNVINIGTEEGTGGTLRADIIAGAYAGNVDFPKTFPNANVINFNHMTVEKSDATDRLKIYAGETGTRGKTQMGNVYNSVINVNDGATIKNADIYGGLTNVTSWGGHVNGSEINLSGHSDLVDVNLIGADVQNSPNGRNISSVLNIGYRENYTLNPSGEFPAPAILDAEKNPDPTQKGTVLTLKPKVVPWTYGSDTSVQNVSNFTTIKVWRMQDENTPALKINGTGSFIVHVPDRDAPGGTVIDITPLTEHDENSAPRFFGNLHPNDERTIIQSNNSVFEENGESATISSNPLEYSYHLDGNNASLDGTYHGDGAFSENNVIWQTGDVNVTNAAFSGTVLDPSDRGSTPLTLEHYGYVFSPETVLDENGMTVRDEGHTLLSTDDSWTLINGEGALSVSGMDSMAGRENPVSYEIAGGAATVSGRSITAASDNRRNLTIHTENPDRITYHTLDWNSRTPVVSLDNTKNYDLSRTTVDWSNLQHEGLRGGTSSRVLLDANGLDSGLTENNLEGNTQHLVSGTTLEGTGRASMDGRNVIYTADMKAQDQTHHTVMAQEAGLATLLESNDLVLDTMRSAERAEDGFNVFATTGGGENRYDTGSHITTNIWRNQTGFSLRNRHPSGAVTDYGLFFDYGDGSYRSFYHGRGDGKINYKGAGLFVKQQEAGGGYEEASLRIGRASNDVRGALRDASGRGYDYKTNSMYNAFHVGLGKKFSLDSGSDLDTYLRFFHTHLNGDSFNAGGHYNIDSADSNILRAGTRWEKKSHNWDWYAGLAYEFEFSGHATGLADGARIRGASIRGGSVRFEYGTQYTQGRWNLALNGSDYAGKRKGFNGNISVGYRF